MGLTIRRERPEYKDFNEELLAAYGEDMGDYDMDLYKLGVDLKPPLVQLT